MSRCAVKEQRLLGPIGTSKMMKKARKRACFVLISDGISMGNHFHEMGRRFSDSTLKITSNSSRNPYVQMPAKGCKPYLDQMVPRVFRRIAQYLHGYCSDRKTVNVRKQVHDELY